MIKKQNLKKKKENCVTKKMNRISTGLTPWDSNQHHDQHHHHHYHHHRLFNQLDHAATY